MIFDSKDLIHKGVMLFILFQGKVSSEKCKTPQVLMRRYSTERMSNARTNFTTLLQYAALLYVAQFRSLFRFISFLVLLFTRDGNRIASMIFFDICYGEKLRCDCAMRCKVE